MAFPKFSPKTVQHQLGSGLATGIFGDAGNVQADPLSFLVPEKVVPALFEGLTQRGPASRFLLNFQPSIDVIGKKTRPTLLGREMPDFIDAMDSVPLGHGLDQLGRAPGPAQHPISVGMMAVMGAIHHGFGLFFPDTAAAEWKGEFLTTADG